MKANKRGFVFSIIFVALFAVSISAQTVKTEDFYPLADGNVWRYVAPPGWKDGDYISKIEREKNDSQNRFLHYDATGAAKILRVDRAKGIFYDGELFADGSLVRFDSSVLWFPKKLKIGDQIAEERSFTRTFKDGKTVRGRFKIRQTIARLETVQTTAGEFTNALRVESETFWELGDRRRARSINVYHYAKQIGVVKASARFIIINEQGKEIINRLVETDLKSYKIQTQPPQQN